MLVTQSVFMGEIPRLRPHMLPENHAETAIGCDFSHGTLKPEQSSQEAVAIAVSPATETVFYGNGLWYTFPTATDVVPGPVQSERLYLTDGGTPKLRNVDHATYDLALPAPINPPSATRVGDLDAANSEEVLYAFTWVTSLGEESPPSPLTTKVLVTPTQAVRLENFPTTPSGRLITHRRIYRSVTSAAGTTGLFFVDEISTNTTFYDHSISVQPAQELIPSDDYDPPPNGLNGIIAMPNGMMAAFKGKDVYFCEPFLPHAWPEKYVLTVNDPIVGLTAFGSTLVVLTTGTPYRAFGQHPETMSMERIEQNYPCLSKRGIVDLGYAAAYPSTNGLVLIDNGGARLTTEAMFTREQWMTLDPASFRASHHEGNYIFTYDDNGTRALAQISLTGANPFFVRHAGPAPIAFYDRIETGELYGVVSGSILRMFDPAASPGTYRYRSRQLHLPAPVVMGAALIETVAGPGVAGQVASIGFYRDGVLIDTITTLDRVVRLPAGMGHRWQYEIQGSAEISRIIIAGNPSEIAGG